jgi:CBS-domain-containing membrane protein
MHASDVMTGDILSIAPEASLEAAIQTMLSENVSALMVVNGRQEIVGILTDTDLLRRVELGTEKRTSRLRDFFSSPGELSSEYAHARGRRVDEVMTREVISVPPEAALDQVVDLMIDRRIKRVPVVSEGVAVGVVRRETLLAMLRDKLRARESQGEARPDDEIRDAIKTELRRRPFLPSVTVDVILGEAVLYGTVSDERERTAIKVAAENVDGVRRIRDQLAVVDPILSTAAY